MYFSSDDFVAASKEPASPCRRAFNRDSRANASTNSLSIPAVCSASVYDERSYYKTIDIIINFTKLAYRPLPYCSYKEEPQNQLVELVDEVVLLASHLISELYYSFRVQPVQPEI